MEKQWLQTLCGFLKAGNECCLAEQPRQNIPPHFLQWCFLNNYAKLLLHVMIVILSWASQWTLSGSLDSWSLSDPPPRWARTFAPAPAEVRHGRTELAGSNSTWYFNTCKLWFSFASSSSPTSVSSNLAWNNNILLIWSPSTSQFYKLSWWLSIYHPPTPLCLRILMG